MATYLDTTKLTDKVATPYFTKDNALWMAATSAADDAVVDLAGEKGVSESSIVVPLHTSVQDFARYY